MAKEQYNVTIWGKRKRGGTATFDVEIEADDAVFRSSDSKGNNEAMKSLVMAQRPDVLMSHGAMEEIKVMGFSKKG
jgi:hypothetical protein